MKRLLSIAFLLLISFFAAIYIFIPSVISVSVYRKFSCSATATFRTVANPPIWQEWFPSQENVISSKGTPHKKYIYQNDTFFLKKASYNNITINVGTQQGVQPTQLIFIPLYEDSLILNWKYTVGTGNNPFMRLIQYREAVNIKKSMDNILTSLANYCSHTKNIYGTVITETSTIDTQLVFKSITMKNQPSINDIYQQIKLLQAHIKEKGVKQTGYPMINVINLEDESYRLMTALPVHTMLSGIKGIVYKRMVPGRFLKTTVIGGESAVNNASQQIQQYIQDYQRVVMAEPFQVLVTNRIKEKDSSKWITMLYFPVK